MLNYSFFLKKNKIFILEKKGKHVKKLVIPKKKKEVGIEKK